VYSGSRSKAARLKGQAEFSLQREDATQTART